MLRRRLSTVLGVTLIAVALSGCGAGSAAPSKTSSVTSAAATASPSATPAPTPSATPPPTATATPAPKLAATAAQLISVAHAAYPACNASCQSPGTKYTTCESGHSPPFSKCPLTARLIAQLQADIKSAGMSAPDPLGGGQDPYWATEAVSAVASVTGGIADVVLGVGTRSNRINLAVVLSSGRLLIDDVYCAGTNRANADAYAPGWMNRSTC